METKCKLCLNTFFINHNTRYCSEGCVKKARQISAKVYREKNQTLLMEYKRRKYKENLEFNRDFSRRYYEENRDLIKERRLVYANENRAVIKERNRERHKKLRDIILSHYRGKCTCCGENCREFLALDHVNNDGNTHRKEFRGGSPQFYRWIIKTGFPSWLQLLCHNCNLSRGIYGYCPHKKANNDVATA